MTSMTVQPDQFRDALKDFPSGVTIVTSAGDGGEPVGATVSAFSSLSLEPPMVLVCLAGKSRSAAAIRRHKAFAIHFLDEAQASLARRFAADAIDKFQDAPFTYNESGVPCLEQCALRLECTLTDEHEGGDHVILIGLVNGAERRADFEPLVFARRGFFSLGNRLVEAS